MGRPTIFTQKLGDEICERIANGESLRKICQDDKMPAMSVIFRWLNDEDKKEFKEQYARAREEQAEFYADELIEIADDGRNDWMEKHDKDGNNIGWQVNGEAIQRSRLRSENRKWIASKLKPKKYGDSTTLRGDIENPLQIKQNTTLTPSEAYLKMLNGK